MFQIIIIKKCIQAIKYFKFNSFFSQIMWHGRVTAYLIHLNLLVPKVMSNMFVYWLTDP